MRKYLAMFLVLFIIGGCGSDDPASPDGGNNPTSIAGVWLGTTALQSLAPANHPIVQTLSPAIGVPSNISISATQNKSNVTLRFTNTESGLYTDYAGTMGTSSFTAQWTYCSAAVITGIECNDGVLRDMALHVDNLTGTVSGNSMTGTVSSTYNCFITSTLAPDGIVSGTASFSVTKSK